MYKRITASLLAFLMVITMLPGEVLAAGTSETTLAESSAASEDPLEQIQEEVDLQSGAPESPEVETEETTMGPDTIEPDTMGADTIEPDTMGPDTIEPDTMGPNTIEPDTTMISSGEYTLSGDVRLVEGLLIPSDVEATIDLNGYTLNGNGINSVVEVAEGGKLTISNGTITGGAHGFFNMGTLIINDVTITENHTNTENHTDDAHGGGIRNQGGTVTVTGGEISRNSAENGAGVWSQDGKLTLTGVSILTNSNNLHDLGEHEERGEGGGVWISLTKSTESPEQQVIENCIISGNVAQTGGGICYQNLCTDEAYLRIEGCTLSENRAEVKGPNESAGDYNNSGLGGGMFFNAPVEVVETDFVSNYAGESGGAVFGTSAVSEIDTFEYASFTGGSMESNEARAAGGGMYQLGVGVNMDGMEVTDNHAGIGGGIAVTDGALNVELTSKIWNNAADSYANDVNVEHTKGGSVGSYLTLPKRDDQTWYCDTLQDRENGTLPPLDQEIQNSTEEFSLSSSLVVPDMMCTVVYNGNGNTGGEAPVDNQKYQKNASATVLGSGTLEKDGYTFAGWNTTANGTGTPYLVGERVTVKQKTVVLYARWTQNEGTCQVIYHGNGNTDGEAPVDSKRYQMYGTATVLGGDTLKKEGEIFVGWTQNQDGNGKMYQRDDSILVDAQQVHLYAQWKPVSDQECTLEYHINCDPADILGTPPAKHTYKLYEKAVVLDGAYMGRQTHEFVAWNTKPDGTGTRYKEGDVIQMDEAHVDLYAIWDVWNSGDDAWHLRYHPNGADGGKCPPGYAMLNTKHEFHDKVSGLDTLYRYGYRMNGWNTKKDGSGIQFGEWNPNSSTHLPEYIYIYVTDVNSDVDLYAQWEPIIVTFDPDGGTFSDGTTEQKRMQTDRGTIETLPTVTQFGYDINGWKDAFRGTKWDKIENQYNINDLTLIPDRTPNSVDICYHRNPPAGRGEDSTLIRSVSFGTPMFLMANNNFGWCEGYYQNGWTTNPDGTGDYYPGRSEFTPNTLDTIHLYAKWENYPEVTFDANGGKFSSGSTTECRFADHWTLKIPWDLQPKRDGYSLVGWYTEPENGEKVVSNLHVEQEITLYAHWELAKYELTYTPGYNGTGVPIVEEHTWGSTVTLKECDTFKPKEEGAVFIGWTVSTDRGQRKNPGDNFTMPLENVTATANWVKDPCTITAIIRGDYEDTCMDIVPKGTVLNRKNMEHYFDIPDGYVLSPWYRDEDYTDRIDESGIEIEQDTTIYAQCAKAQELTINFDAMGGTAGPAGPLIIPSEVVAICDGWGYARVFNNALKEALGDRYMNGIPAPKSANDKAEFMTWRMPCTEYQNGSNPAFVDEQLLGYIEKVMTERQNFATYSAEMWTSGKYRDEYGENAEIAYKADLRDSVTAFDFRIFDNPFATLPAPEGDKDTLREKQERYEEKYWKDAKSPAGILSDLMRGQNMDLWLVLSPTVVNYSISKINLVAEYWDTEMSDYAFPVYYDTNGGAWKDGEDPGVGHYAPDNPNVPVTKNVPVPQKSGYVFAGWTCKDLDADKLYQPGETFTMPGNLIALPDGVDAGDAPEAKRGYPITLVAQWTKAPSNEVTFLPGEHGTLTGTTSFQLPRDTSLLDNQEKLCSVTAEEGWLFTDWLGSDGKHYTSEAVMELPIAANMTFTAQYRKASSHQGPITPTEPEPVRPAQPDNSSAPSLNTTEHYSYIVGFEDGTLRPYNTITRGEVATIFFRLLTDEARNKYWCQTNNYTDVPADIWCNNAISTLTNMGIIDGYSDGSFQPYGTITRAQFVKIAVGFFETTAKEYAGYFTDVAADAWYTSYVEAAARVGLISGFEDGTFRPDAPITRAEACVIVNRALDRHPDEKHLLPVQNMVTWPDNTPGDWFYADMQEATNSHDYRMTTSPIKNPETGAETKIEAWTKKLGQRDWAAFEKN